ncbi:ribonuclease H-like domain-containing protein [Tanacetum coccineum]
MPSPSVSTFTFPSTTEPVFSVSTSEPVFESPNHSQTSQTTQSQQLQQYHTTTVSNNNAKFPYLKKEEYETWAMKMEYWIMNSDHNLWNIVLNGNSRKKTGRDPKGNIMILPPVSVEEHIAVQRETKARTILLQSLPEDHMADFHHLDDARDIWLAVKARFGGNDESKKMRKSMLKQEFSEFRLRTLEIDVKGGSSYDSRGTSAPTHSAFISAASTNSKMSYPKQSHSTTFTSSSSSPTASSNVIENVLHSFVAESEPRQQITYDDFDQIGKLDLEELVHNGKWKCSCSINRFEKKAGRNMKFNNKDAARLTRTKVKCYKCSELGHFARECTGKQLDSKARYSSFKLKELDKSEEPKALLFVDSMLNWLDHEGEDVENGAAQVYGMIAEAREDAAGSATGDATSDVADDVSNAAAEFSLMGISSKVKLEESNARFDKWKESSKNLVKLINSSIETLSIEWICQRLGMHVVPPLNYRNIKVLLPNEPDLDDHWPILCVKSSSSKTNEPLASTPSSVDFKTVSETPDQQPSSTNDDSSFSFKENVKPPRNLCNKVLELHNKPMWNNVANIPSFCTKAILSCGSRNRPASVPADHRHYFQHFSRPGYYNQMNMDKREDGELLLSPQQVVLGDSKGQNMQWGFQEQLENPHKNKDLGIVDRGTVTFGGGDGVPIPKNSQVVLRVPRRNNLYCFNLSDIKLERDVTCLLRERVGILMFLSRERSLLCELIKAKGRASLYYMADGGIVSMLGLKLGVLNPNYCGERSFAMASCIAVPISKTHFLLGEYLLNFHSSLDIRDQLNAEAEAVQIILIGIDVRIT